MKVKVGDQVKFLNDTGGGKVTKILSKDMANVLTHDGFEVPVLMEELLISESGEQEKKQGEVIPETETEEERAQEQNEEYNFFKEAEPDEKDIPSAGNPDNEIHFAFVPLNLDQPENSDLDLFLINDSDFEIYYLILVKKETSYSWFASGYLEDNTKILIKTVERENLNEINDLKFQLLFFRKGFFHPVSPMETNLKIKPARFFKRSTFKENDFFDEPAWIMELKSEERFYEQLRNLKDEDILQAVKEKDLANHDFSSLKSKPKSTNSDIEEVDLHIEELVEKPNELSNSEIIEIQLARFQTTLEGALNDKHTKRIVFIHGVGNGRLRYELRKSLERNYPKLNYQDASFKEYGYGATLVFLK
ncbi:MAG: DUF2027 domain-containing protein [Bacteroidota bacterium]